MSNEIIKLANIEQKFYNNGSDVTMTSYDKNELEVSAILDLPFWIN